MFSTSLFRRVVAEAIGTYTLVTAGCGAIIVNSSPLWPLAQPWRLVHYGVAR